MGRTRWFRFIPLIMLVSGALACDDGPGHITYPVENRGITCITVDSEGRLIAPIKVGGFTENAGNYDLLISENGGLTWEVDYHRDRKTPIRQPYGITSLNVTLHPPGEMPACETSSRAVNPNNPNHRVWFEQGLRIYESRDGTFSEVIHDLPELRQEIRYYFFGRYPSLYHDIPVLEVGPHDVEFDPVTGNIVFAMGWDGVLVYTPTGRWQWVSVYQYGQGAVGRFDQAAEPLRDAHWLAVTLGFVVLTSLVTYLVRRSKYRISMLIIGWIGWGVMLLAGTPTSIQGIMPGVSRGGVFFLLGAPLLLLVALPMIVLSLVDLLQYLFRRSIYLIVISAMIGAASLLPYYLWIQGTIFRYEAAKWTAFVLTVGMVGFVARMILTTSQGWAQRINLPPKRKRGQHPI